MIKGSSIDRPTSAKFTRPRVILMAPRTPSLGAIQCMLTMYAYIYLRYLE